MNRHFEDARYYLKRAGETTAKGVRQELEPVESRLRELTGRERDPEPTRIEEVRTDLAETRVKVENEVREAVAETRRTVENYREKRTA